MRLLARATRPGRTSLGRHARQARRPAARPAAREKRDDASPEPPDRDPGLLPGPLPTPPGPKPPEKLEACPAVRWNAALATRSSGQRKARRGKGRVLLFSEGFDWRKWRRGKLWRS